MPNITPIEPEFSADYINDGNTAEVINELRVKINELVAFLNMPVARAVAQGGRRTRKRRKKRKKRKKRKN
jgi:hypothetical protein